MPKKIYGVAKDTGKAMVGGVIGAALEPIATIGMCMPDGLTAGPGFLIGLTLCGPAALYGFGRGAEIAVTINGGIKKVPGQIFSPYSPNHTKETHLGSNFFTFFGKEARESRKEKRRQRDTEYDLEQRIKNRR